MIWSFHPSKVHCAWKFHRISQVWRKCLDGRKIYRIILSDLHARGSTWVMQSQAGTQKFSELWQRSKWKHSSVYEIHRLVALTYAYRCSKYKSQAIFAQCCPVNLIFCHWGCRATFLFIISRVLWFMSDRASKGDAEAELDASTWRTSG